MKVRVFTGRFLALIFVSCVIAVPNCDGTGMTKRKTWTIGITHLVKPPFDPEQRAFDENVEIVFFDERDESAFDVKQLNRLDAFLVWTPTITARTISQLHRCKILVRYGVGYDKIDLGGLRQQGIAFSNNPEYGPEDVADTAMAMLLSLQRKIHQHDVKARNYYDSWQENHLVPVCHSKRMTVGIVGLGRIGSCLSLRLKPFGYRLLGYDPYVINGMFRSLDVEPVDSLEALMEQVDMVSFHCPLTQETRSMINAESLAAAKPGLVLVNTARGHLVDNLDLIADALESGLLAAAGLDVLPDEPPGKHRLIDDWRAGADWLSGRLLINPHNAFYSDYSMDECRYNAACTARLFLEQNKHRNAV